MGTYAAITDVEAMFPGLPAFSTSTQPTLAEVTAWITEAEAMLEGAMQASQLTVPNVDERGIEILSSWACLYAGGQVRNALAAAANDPSNAAGQPMLDKFDEKLNWILDNSARAGSMLEGGSAPSESRGVRAPSNLDDNGDEIGPIFTRDETVDDIGNQF